MRSLIAFAALAAVSAAGMPVRAAEDPVNCAEARNTVEINFCAEKDYNEADAALNAAYKAVLAQINKSTGEKPYDAKSWENAFRAAQRAWIAYRDAECKGVVPMEWSGGTGTASAVLGCMTQLTEERTKLLKARIEEPAGPARVP